uniref:Uncharacterized protein n=1 Tax=uncultured gamma proteobacterium HF0010_26J14 TaxID=723564 RepID=E7C1V2_9GAMM|nr:hypothetical protein [uncultured gamma proteobacterium HF0010_26J14]
MWYIFEHSGTVVMLCSSIRNSLQDKKTATLWMLSLFLFLTIPTHHSSS